MTSTSKYRSNGIESSDVREIANHDLPSRVADLVDDYETHIGDRDRFLWKWIHTVLPKVTLSTVPRRYEDEVIDAKLVASMFVVLLDDVGEKHQDRATLREASKVAFEEECPDHDRADVDSEVLAIAEQIWSRYEDLIGAGPRHQEFRTILQFDLRQAINAIEYSLVVNENLEMATLEELWAHDSHNMMIFLFTTSDLAFSPSFDRDDLAVLRQAVWDAQKLARIGNWVTTWERELREGDFSSGIIISAIDQDIVSTSDLYAVRAGELEPDRIIATIKEHDIEEQFLREWRDIESEARRYESQTDSVDIGSYLDGMRTVLRYHLASRGMK